MSRQCRCGGVLSIYDLTGAREAWKCSECKRYEIKHLGAPQIERQQQLLDTKDCVSIHESATLFGSTCDDTETLA